MRTVDKMIENKVLVRASCSSCDTVVDVDLEDLKAKNGGDGSLCLINKRGRCKVPGCGGKVTFLYERVGNGPLFPLVDHSH